MSNLPKISALIRRKLLWRVLLVFFVVLVLFLFVSVYVARLQLKKLEGKIVQQCQPLSSFLVAQYLIDNKTGISVALAQKTQSSAFASAYIWLKPSEAKLVVAGFKWFPPFSWNYFYPVHLPGGALAYIKVEGKVLAGIPVVKQMVQWFLLSLGVVLGLLFILYPIIRKIPQQLFILPVNQLLALLAGSEGLTTAVDTEEMDEIRHKISQLVKASSHQAEQKALNEVSAQVAHDIRSPLAALNIAVANLSALPERQRNLIRNASQRINDIANNLLSEYRSEAKAQDDVRVEMLSLLIQQLVSEKRAQFRGKRIKLKLLIDDDAQGLFVKVDAAKFSRALSNLINNAVEASEDGNEVKVSLTQSQNMVSLVVSDEGCGMAPELLEKALAGGVSVGKSGGSGIGLSSAVALIKSWGGNVLIQSGPGEGTAVSILLRSVMPPVWFPKQIALKQDMRLVVLDDDQSIHDVWTARFVPLQVDVVPFKLKHFYQPDALCNWEKNRYRRSTLYLVDCELGQEKTGVELVQNLGIARQTILVTSRFEDADVRRQCEAMGLRLMPKYYAQFIPITVSLSDVDLVFVDDSAELTDAWQAWAELEGKVLRTFNTAEDMLANLDEISPETPIYVDANLGGVDGVSLTRQLSQHGFKCIYLATGYDRDKFPDTPWLKDIVGKEPPSV